MRPPLFVTPALAVSLLLAACGDSSAVVYRIPKEHDTPALVAATPDPAVPVVASSAANPAEGPGLRWTAPAHWQSKPASAMRKATYAIDDGHGETADVSVTAFPGDVGGELANVNRWRGQLGLPPLADTDLAGAVTRREQNGLSLTIVDITGQDSAAGRRMLGAIVPFGGATWFFKLTGPAVFVAREKNAFLEFLGTLHTP